MRESRLVFFLLAISATYSCVVAGSLPKKTKEIHAGNMTVTGFFGPVKSVRVEAEATGDESGKPVESPRQLSMVMQYDPKGQVTKAECYDRRGAATSYKCTYDGSGNQTAVKVWHCANPKAAKPEFKLVGKYSYKYDDKGNVVEECDYSASSALTGKSVGQFNAQGKMTEYASFGPGGKQLVKGTRKYDSSGNCVETEVTDDRGTSKSTSKYDSSGRQTEHIRYKEDGTLQDRFTYAYKGKRIQTTEYNPDGKVAGKEVRENHKRISEVGFSPDGTSQHKTEWSYDLDKYGNPTKTIKVEETTQNGKCINRRVSIGYAKIAYYK